MADGQLSLVLWEISGVDIVVSEMSRQKKNSNLEQVVVKVICFER